MNKTKLLELVALLESVQDQDDAMDAGANNLRRSYNQCTYKFGCGAPACALGHWAVAHSDRWEFMSMQTTPKLDGFFGIEAAAYEFELRYDTAYSIFNGAGCGNAETAAEAAAYIRKVVEEAE